MHLSVHTKDSHKAVPFSVARLKMDLAFHNHPAYNRVHRERPAPLTPPFFSSTARKGGHLALKQCLWEVPALAADLLLVEVRGVAIAVLQHRKQRRQSLARRSRNSRPQGEAQRNLGRLPLHFRCSVSLWPAEAQGETSVSLSLTLYGNSPEPFGHSVSSLQEIPSVERAHPRDPVGQQPMPAGLSTRALEIAHACTIRVG